VTGKSRLERLTLAAAMPWLLGCTTGSPAASSDSAETDRAAILAERAAWNRGMAARDTAAYRAPWAAGIQFTTGGGQVVGRDSLASSTAALLQSRPDLFLELRPARVTVNAAWGLASEEGEWVERWREPSGMTELRGPYFSLWRHENGHWRIAAEILHPATCTGSDYCKPDD